MRRALLCALVLVAACRRGPSHDDCAKLFDHFLDVEGQAATDGQFTEMAPPMTAALADEKAKFRKQLGGGFVDLCKSDLSQAEVDCAMTAASEAGMDDCERP